MTHEEAVAALARCREGIDAIDLQILELLNQRTSIVEQIGYIKQESAMPIYEPRRETQVFHNVMSHNQGPLSPDSVKRVFERIIDEMRKIQRERMEAERYEIDQAKGGDI